MTKDEKYSLARWAMQHALKSGAKEASVSLSESVGSDVEIREQKIDTLKEAIQSSLNIRLYVDGKYSSLSTNRLNKKELAKFIEEGVEATRYLAEDPFRSLPDAALYYKGNGPELAVLDTSYDNIDPKTKVDLAFQVEAEAFQKDERILSVSAYYSDRFSSRILMASNGFEGETGNSSFSLNASVSVNGGNARPSESWSERAIFFEKLKKSDIASKALGRAIKKIGSQKIKSGKFPMIVENRAVGRLLYPLLNALDGSSIQQKDSFLIDKIGQQVASPVLTLTDDPFIIGGRGSALFDREGMATTKRNVFENGVLKTYFIDTYYAKKLEMAPTSGDTTNLVFSLGDKDLDSMVASLKSGILVTGFNGGNTNGSTGDFSYGIDGFLIENGELKMPISEMNITGNMKNLWMSLAETGNDPELTSSWQTPSMLFSSVDFSGI